MPESKTDYRRKVKELSLLFHISQILERSINLKEVITPVLRLLTENMGLFRGTIGLLNRQTGKIQIEAAYELSEAQKKRGIYKPGEGIIGRVVKEGKPIIVPVVSKEPGFLDKTGAVGKTPGKEYSFICVPIKNGNEVIGTLSGDRLFSPEIKLDDDVRLLSIITSMIAQAVQLRQKIQEERQKLVEENKRLQHELTDKFRPANIIGNSAVMRDVFDLIMQVSKSEATVLILGESGTGKELVAHAIHYNSLRAKMPFIKVNCAALPESVIESELFGHEKGAFTGAVSVRKGRFERADGGTLFLDEIGDLSPATQIKLLRVLQEKEIERVGGTDTIPINVRIITATNVDLEKKLKEGEFREDLFYRLNVFPIHMPPLRDRKSDIMLLVDYFAEKYGKKNNIQVKRIATSAIDLFMSYHWPGNVRELENSIERAVLLGIDNVIYAHHLPPSLQSADSTGTGLHSTLDEALESLEKELLLDALKSSRGNMAKASRSLKITERQIGLRVKKYAIDLKKRSR